MPSQPLDQPVGFAGFKTAADYPGGVFFRPGLLGGGVKFVPFIFQFFHHAIG
jgi:hypothetical protein